MLAAIAVSCPAQTTARKNVANTIAVNAGDSREQIVEKAAHVVPSAVQFTALKNEFIAFVHFGPNTFTRMEWGTGKEDPAIFDLKELHTDQWCEAMKAAGMKMVIFTAKHHDGFVLWQSRYTKHGIMSTGFENGRGDVLKALAASCKNYGLKLGVYLSPADLYQIENPDGLYGNLSPYTKRSIPREVPGRPFANKTRFEFMADDYNEYFLNQLFELLTEYGPISEVWFDGAHPKRKGGQQYNYAAWKKLIHTLAPGAVIFGREDIRWCGNESGSTRAAEWNVIPYPEDPRTADHFPDMSAEDIGSRDSLYKAKFLHYQPAETNTSIREGWFYRDDQSQKVRSVDDVFDIYERAVGGNSIFLLNTPPNRDGKFSAEDVRVLTETGNRIREAYGKNLLLGSTAAAQWLDNNPGTYKLLSKKEREIIISTPAPVTVNRFLLQEAVRTHGERVEAHMLDAWIGDRWEEIATAANIGYKRILRFPTVTASKFRLRIAGSRLDPALATIGAYYYKSRPPQLQVSRAKDGKVTIQPLQTDFNWKPHHENEAENLYKDLAIYYTTDGTQPTPNSNRYDGPFNLAKGEVKAMAVTGNAGGPVASAQIGIVKNNWKLTVGSESEKHPAAMAADEDKTTWWQSEASTTDHYIAVDLGSTYRLTAFSYTPQKQTGRGMLAKGNISVSADGSAWQPAGSFAFGNLVNDPSTRNYIFPAAIDARYIRIEATEIANGDQILTVAELDFYEQ